MLPQAIIEPIESPLWFSSNMEWPVDGKWVEVVLSTKNGPPLNSNWKIRIRVMPNGHVAEANEVNSDGEFMLMVEENSCGEAGYRFINKGGDVDSGYLFYNDIREGRAALVLIQKHDFKRHGGYEWVIYRD